MKYQLHDRLYLTLRAYIKLLQAFFKNWDEFKWSENSDETKVVISSVYPKALEAKDKLPMVLVNILDAAWQGSSPHPVMYENPFNPKGPKIYSDVVHSAAEITCIAQNDIVARRLGWAVFTVVPVFRHFLEKFGGADFVDPRLRLSSVFDAGQYLNSGPGLWYGVKVVSPFRIGHEIILPAESVLANTLKDIQTVFQSDKENK